MNILDTPYAVAVIIGGQKPIIWASLVAQLVKNLPAIWEMWVRFLGQGDSLEKEMGTPLQYSCLDNPMDRGARWATVYGAAKD